MTITAAVYNRLPAPLQDVAATMYGVQQRRLRHSGAYASYVELLDESQWWDRQRLHDHQAVLLRRILNHALRHVPHYRETIGRSAIRDWDDPARIVAEHFPLLEKEVVRSAPTSFVSERAPKLVEQKTGGTTGTPLRYWATPEAVKFNYATYEARCRAWAGVAFGDRMASMNGKVVVPVGQDRPPFWRRNLAFNQLYLSIYHLSDANLPSYVDRLERWSPSVIVGYVSAVHRVAAHIVRTGDIGRIRPRAVIVSSETLTPSARATIEAAFGCKAWDGYSLGELVAFVSECEEGRMHVSPEYGLLELIDTDIGHEIVATGLSNLGMPLIRYRTGDLVEPTDEQQCPCGRSLPVVGRILGRVDDVIVTPEGVRVGPAPLSLAFQNVPNLKAAQMHQSDVSATRVLLDWADGHTPDDEEQLRRELRLRLGGTIDLELEPVESLPQTSGGKQRLVVSSLSDAVGS